MKVLFVNHLEQNCGVYQYFKKLTKPIFKDTTFETHYIETNQEWECDYWIQKLDPAIIVYNYYFSGSTMPWLNLEKNRHRKQIGIHHEGNTLDKGFDLVLHQDPTNTDTRYFNLTRPIPKYEHPLLCYGIVYPGPIIGSFGFGLGGKGFTRVVETVVNEFDSALVRLNIPFAHFGDANGDGARWWAQACQAIAAQKPGIELRVTHDLLPENDLLHWLSLNDINCFFYDHNIGRGLSGTVDYALAINKPIALTQSDQFRHFWTYDDRMLIENHTIHELIDNGADYLQVFKHMWSDEKLIERFHSAFHRVLGV